MNAATGWQFAVEVNPAGWRFPRGESWIAGWILPEPGQLMTDVRARLHHRVVSGLSGLPHPAFGLDLPGQDNPIRPGFSFSLAPQLGATLLQLEARDVSGRWTEFFRTTIMAAPDALAAAVAPRLAPALGPLVKRLLRDRLHAPHRPWGVLADNLLANFVSEPLNAHPSMPLIGALEEPSDIGRRRNGCIPVTGWLAHPTARIKRLTAVIDSLPVTLLPHGLARPDVAGIFPALLDQENSAFVGAIPLPENFSGPVLLKLFAELDDGAVLLAYARRFTPKLHGESGQLPPGLRGITFVCAVWALHRSAVRYALPRQGLIRAARDLWAGYRAIPVYQSKQPPALLEAMLARARPAAPGSPAGQPGPAVPGFVPVNPHIAAGDDMCGPDTARYFQLGREALGLLQEASAGTGNPRIENILDLPCGHGRVARWLRQAYPEARLSVSDLQEPGVDFCIAQLGATGVVAALDGSHWAALTGPFDLIWCGSLLTHLGRDQWIDHLRRFAERLAPQGVLVFTSHGVDVLAKLQAGEKDYGLSEAQVRQLCASALAEGFGYADYEDQPGYGISLAQPAWIMELIAAETDLQVRDYRPAAWDQHQDIVVCTRRLQVTL